MYGPELTQGTAIGGRYILKEYKGSGSFGEVWLAEDSELGIDVAIKLYISLDQKGQDEFKEEYKVAYGLSHENLLTAQYYSVWDHRPYLIMKYCSRGSAASMGGAASEEEIWKFIHDVASGLRYLHSQEPPIVHQDIKPENILIDEQGNFLITDFGISKKMRTTMRKQSKRSIESGAIAYMGPERFLKDPMAVKASDIWSLGVSIYEMATNDLPFMGQGGGMLNAGAAIPELDPNKWSANLNAVMEACLAKDTWDRPTAEELVEYTNLILKGKDISWSRFKAGEHEMPQPLPQPTPSSGGTSKIWLIVAGVVAVVLVVGAIIFFSGGSTTGDDPNVAIAHKYENMRSMFWNDIQVGDAQNYMSLLAARSLLDSLERYEREYPFLYTDSVSPVPDMKEALGSKIDEAQQAWVKSAQGQIDIAEDVSAGIQYYHIAAQLKSTPDVVSALDRIAKRSGCPGAYMVVTEVGVDGGNLVIHYNGLNEAPVSDVTISYDLYSDGGDSSRGEATFTLRPGTNQTVEIEMDGVPADLNNLALKSNGIQFYNSKIF